MVEINECDISLYENLFDGNLFDESPSVDEIIIDKRKSNKVNNHHHHHHNKDLDETASDHELYLQNCFQDELVNDIFDDIEDYIRTQAIPICEYLTRDSVEEMIDLFLV